jgi:hypothetical protein
LKPAVQHAEPQEGRHLWVWLLALALLSIAGAWLGWRDAGQRPLVARRALERGVVAEQQTSARAPLAAHVERERAPARALVQAAPEPAPEDDGADEADEARHPHPITPQHERIFRENNLVGALNHAMDRRDAARLRELNAQYRQEYPEDAQVLQEGYELIADCIERPTQSTEQAGRRFWQEQRASSLRRYVRRHCFTE